MTKPIAVLAINPKPVNRYYRFVNGLNRNGWTEVVLPHQLTRPLMGGDILITWNIRPQEAGLIAQARDNGVPHLVAENAYIRQDEAGRQYHALALDGHNGSGRWPRDKGERWERMGVSIAPWRNTGDWYVVIEQRGIGAPGMAMPVDWANQIAEVIRTKQNVHVEVRRPPSRSGGQMPLMELLDKARVVIVWTSNVATQALLAGVPVTVYGPSHICWEATGPIPSIDRFTAFRTLACAQWTHEEIANGYAIGKLLELYRG